MQGGFNQYDKVAGLIYTRREAFSAPTAKPYFKVTGLIAFLMLFWASFIIM